MKKVGLALLAAAWAFSAASGAAASNAPHLSASVIGPPTVQRVGHSYVVGISVKNSGGWVPRFCIDFGDDNNSWEVLMPGLKAYDSDTFCYGTLRGHSKQFLAHIVAAKTGEKKLSICLGTATYYKELNQADLEGNELCWNETVVIA